jgi:hypothetical protein
MPKKRPVLKRPVPQKRVSKQADQIRISRRQMSELAKKTIYLQHSARLADFHYRQKLVKEFKKAYEDYIG